MKNPYIQTVKQFIALIKTDPNNHLLNSVDKIAKGIINYLNLKVVKKTFYHFNPVGLTLVYILSQSHLVIHTYPETGIIHIDLVICNDINEKEFKKSLKMILSSYQIKFIKIKILEFGNYF